MNVKLHLCFPAWLVLSFAVSGFARAEEISNRYIKVIIDPKSMAYLDGTELDFVREGLNEGFRFNNPNERDRCGCGESFRI